jgi:hypothetical protein
VLIRPIGLRKHVVADKDATAAHQTESFVYSVVFTLPRISEYEIERLARLPAYKRQAVGQFERDASVCAQELLRNRLIPRVNVDAN